MFTKRSEDNYARPECGEAREDPIYGCRWWTVAWAARALVLTCVADAHEELDNAGIPVGRSILQSAMQRPWLKDQVDP